MMRRGTLNAPTEIPNGIWNMGPIGFSGRAEEWKMDARGIFVEVHHGLPREAPADEASTLQALGLLKELPIPLSILDIGCRPGA